MSIANNKMEIIFDHAPIAKMRHRHQKNGFTYDPQNRTKKEVRKKMVCFINGELKRSIEGAMLIGEICASTAFLLRFVFEFPIPESDPIYVKNLKQWNLIEHNIKPDLSNLMKFYEDCANSIFFQDDSMIIACQMIKKYSSENKPRVIMTLIPQKTNLSKKSQEVLEVINPSRLRELMKACHTLTTLPLMQLEDSPNDKKTEYLDYISTTLVKFASEFSNDLVKIKRKCSMETTNDH